MEPIDLTCPKCGKAWKLIKAGTGPVTCPHCKAALPGPGGEQTATIPTPVVATALERPAATAATTPVEPAAPPDLLAVASPSSADSTAAQSPFADTDDPALAADFDDRFETHRRPGKHPLVKVIIILLVLAVLLPLAVFILFLIVCAVMFAAR